MVLIVEAEGEVEEEGECEGAVVAAAGAAGTLGLLAIAALVISSTAAVTLLFLSVWVGASSSLSGANGCGMAVSAALVWAGEL